MRDDFQDYSPDPSSQRSVTDWLMQVISGKKPLEGHAAPERARAEGSSAVAVEEMPHKAAPEKTAVAVQDGPRKEEQVKPVQDEKPFTAEDLCGPAVFRPSVPTSAPPSVKEEITADDLCFVPKGQEIKPQQNGTGAIVEPKEPLRNGVGTISGTTWTSQNGIAPVSEANEPPRNGIAPIAETKESQESHESQKSHEHVITAADIVREGRLDAGQYVATPHFSHAEVFAMPEHDVTAADITRDSVLHQMESLVEATATQAETKPETSGAADHGSSAEAQEAKAEVHSQTMETQHEVQPEPVKSATATEVGPQEKTASAPAGNAVAVSEGITIPVKEIGHEAGTEPVAAASTAEELSHENKPQDGKESVFAHPGIWGNAAREQGTASEGDAYSDATSPRQEEQEPDYAEAKQPSLSPENLKEIEEMKPEGVASALKTLMKLGSVMPWLARPVPTPEGGSGANSGLAPEAPHEVAHLRMVQYEIRSTVHDHSLQLKRMEEQLTRVREVMESESSEHAELTESVMATVKLVRLMGMGLGALLLTLIVMVGLILVHGGR
jgi:hypothetical protein